jgi:predicted NBD/HSP70 family sugar kinase
MQHYVGLDVSVKETSVCIVDKTGKVIREVKVATEPVAILAVLTEEELAIERIGLEAGPEDISSALKGGVNLCQRNLINEVPPLNT